MESLSIFKACPSRLTLCCCKSPSVSSFNMVTLQSSGCLSFSGCVKHHESWTIGNVKLPSFRSSGTPKRTFNQVVRAGEIEVQMQNEQEAESESKSVASPIEQNASELPSATAEDVNQKKGVKTETFWLLRSTTEEGKSQEIIPGDGVLVGAAPIKDGSSVPLVVDFSMVSSVHAHVYSREKRANQTTTHEYFVMDLGSTNGTYLNRSKLRPQTEVKLSRGDTLKFGDENAVFVVESQS